MAASLEAIWGVIPYPAFVLNAADRVTLANTAAEVFAATSARQMGLMPFAQFVGDGSSVMDVVLQARSRGVSVAQHDVEVTWGDRPTVLHNLHASPIAEGEGDVLLLMHPRALAERMDRSLSHRSAAKSVTGMAAMLAHELRNPLAGISGAAQLLGMNVSDEDAELPRLIEEEVRRIGTLIDRVEQFGDIRPTLREPVNIHDILERSKRAARAGFAAHVRFNEEYDPSLPLAAGDPDQLIQVIQNLLKNAAEAAPKNGGVITIRTAYKPGVKLTHPGRLSESLPLLVTITDNGTGIPETLIRDIFEPFVTTKANGTGLGLSLVSKLISDHGGVVECESRPGRTMFSIRLPLWRGGETV
jgi:two-component system, NtrC family, nitrogen regulation sensor histidine kinase GlnL